VKTALPGRRLSITLTTPARGAEFARGRGPEKCFIALGYAGWEAGQLEQELMENCWLNAPAGADILYDAPYDRRWEFATAQLGFKPHNLSSQIGHA
jgi:putative transcriptional regulator